MPTPSDLVKKNQVASLAKLFCLQYFRWEQVRFAAGQNQFQVNPWCPMAATASGITCFFTNSCFLQLLWATCAGNAFIGRPKLQWRQLVCLPLRKHRFVHLLAILQTHKGSSNYWHEKICCWLSVPFPFSRSYTAASSLLFPQRFLLSGKAKLLSKFHLKLSARSCSLAERHANDEFDPVFFI